MEKAADF